MKFYLKLEMHPSRPTRPTGSFMEKSGVHEYLDNLIKFTKDQENDRKKSKHYAYTVYKTGRKSVY